MTSIRTLLPQIDGTSPPTVMNIRSLFPPDLFSSRASAKGLESWKAISDRVELLDHEESRQLEQSIMAFERARIEVEYQLERCFPGFPPTSVLLSLKHLQELLAANTLKSAPVEETTLFKPHKEVPSFVEDLVDDKTSSRSKDINMLSEGTVELDTDEGDPYIKCAIEKALKNAHNEKTAAVEHICDLLGPLAKVGADVRARELEKVFYVKSLGWNVDREVLSRGIQGPNIMVDAQLYDYRLFSGMSLGQRLGDLNFKTFYSIWPDQVQKLQNFPKLAHILNYHFTVKQIQRIPPTLFKISSGPFDFTKFLTRFERWIRLLKEEDISTDDGLKAHCDAACLYIELENIGREATAGWQHYVDHNTVRPRLG